MITNVSLFVAVTFLVYGFGIIAIDTIREIHLEFKKEELTHEN